MGCTNCTATDGGLVEGCDTCRIFNRDRHGCFWVAEPEPAAEPDEDDESAPMPCEAHCSQHSLGRNWSECDGAGLYTYCDTFEGNLHVCGPCHDYCDAAAELEHEEESDEDEPEPEPERAPRWSADAAAAATAARDEQSIMARARAEAALEMQQLNAAGGVAEPEAEPELEEQVCTEPEHESPSD